MMKIGDEMIACSCANPACLEKGCQLQSHPSAHTLNIIPHTTDEVIRLKQEVEGLKARLRKTAQILIQAVGADGPMEVGVFNQEGNMIQLSTSDTILGWQSTDDVASLISKVSMGRLG